MVQCGDIWEAFETVAKAGGVAAIHAEDNDIVMFMYRSSCGRTVLRGKVIPEGGQFSGDPRDGQFVPRKVADDGRARPAA